MLRAADGPGLLADDASPLQVSEELPCVDSQAGGLTYPALLMIGGSAQSTFVKQPTYRCYLHKCARAIIGGQYCVLLYCRQPQLGLRAEVHHIINGNTPD